VIPIGSSVARAPGRHTLAGAILQPEIRSPDEKRIEAYCSSHAEAGALALARNVRELQNLWNDSDPDAQQHLAISYRNWQMVAVLAPARAGNAEEQDRIVRILKETKGHVVVERAAAA